MSRSSRTDASSSCGTFDPVDGLGLAQELGHLPAVVASEVRAHARPEVGGLAHVQDAAGAVLHQVDAGPAGEAGGETQLARRRVRTDGRQGEQVVEPEHAEGAGAFEQCMEHLGGRGRVGERAVARRHRHAQMTRQRAELEVGHLVAHQPPGEPDGVDPSLFELRVPVGGEGCVEERDVEPDVVPHDHRAADELEQGWQDLVDLGCGQEHCLGDPGEDGDERGDRDARVHEGLEPPEQLAAAVLHRAHLGDRAVVGRGAGGLEVEHHEGHLGQRRAEVVEAGLPRGVHGRSR